MRNKVRLINAPEYLAKDQEMIGAWLVEVARYYKAELERLSYQFLNNDNIRSVNRQFLDHDYATDIITFDYTEKAQVSAEVYCGYEVIEENAKRYGESLKDEMHRVLAHGLLHCLGLDDQSPENKQEMRAAEDKCLNLRPQKLRGA